MAEQAPPPEERPVPDTAITDLRQAEAMAHAAAPHEEFLGYARLHNIPLLVGVVEDAQRRARDAADAATAAYAQRRAEETQVAEAAEADEAAAAAHEVALKTDLFAHPMFATITGGRGAVYPMNDGGREMSARRGERHVREAIGHVTREVTSPPIAQAVPQVLTLKTLDDGRTLVTYHTPGFVTGGYPRVTMGCVIDPEHAAHVVGVLLEDPSTVVQAFTSLQEVSAGTSQDFSSVRPPFEQWKLIGIRRAGSAAPEMNIVPFTYPKPEPESAAPEA